MSVSASVPPPSKINLDAPLAWTKATPDEQRMLRSLQGNILKGHGRDHVALLFFRFTPGQNAPASQHAARRVLRELANLYVTDAHKQLLDTAAFKETKVDGGAFVHLALSFAGYTALGLATSAPADTHFTSGMKGDSVALGDTPDKWEPGFTGAVHGVVLAADSSNSARDQIVLAIHDLLAEGAMEVVHVQRGDALKNSNGVGIEHFGYVDGRSQPLMLQEDIDVESDLVGTARWNPEFSPGIALVPDPGAKDGLSYGSYLVFRKLEQDVRSFKRREQEVADALGLKGEDRERAGALIVGRFEDGTPVTLFDEAKGLSPVPNDFNYVGDAQGSRCPFHAHIRKVNPRTPASAGSVERTHIMPRRGIPYQSEPRVHPDSLPPICNLAEFEEKVAPKLPEKDVGLLFMAYNFDIGKQFVFTQSAWANNNAFPPGTNAGIDPVIGQGPAPVIGEQGLHKAWDDASPIVKTKDVLFSGFVTTRGGEYFFSPSLTFLKNL